MSKLKPKFGQNDFKTTNDDLVDSSAEIATVEDPAIDNLIQQIESNEKQSGELDVSPHSHTAHDLSEKSTSHIRKPKWFKSKKFWIWTVTCLAIIIIALGAVPVTRYWILNHLGVRASLTLTVIDQKTSRPINGANIVVAGQTATTDSDGHATLNGLTLGSTKLVLTKRSYAPLTQSIVVGWGSNLYQQPIQLIPVGSQYTFLVQDWLSTNPIAKADIVEGSTTAITDDKGKAVLQIDQSADLFIVTVKYIGYLDQKITIAANKTSETVVNMVPIQQDIFISKRSGKYDLYKRDVDGNNEVILLPGTGNEQDDIQFLVSADSMTIALVSSRDGKRDKNGNLINNLYMVDVGTKIVTKVPNSDAHSIKLLDWVNDKIVYRLSPVNSDPQNTNNQQIISFDNKQDKIIPIVSANLFNDSQVINGQIYYAISSYNNSSSTQLAQLYRVNPDSSNRITLLDQEVYRLVRTAYNKLQASAKDNKWYEQTIGDNKFVSASGAPANQTNHIYANSLSGDNAAWIDNRDGKGALLINNISSQKEKVALTQAGLGYPIRWLNDKYLLLRVSNLQETADYVYNIDGGPMKKVGDVSNIY